MDNIDSTIEESNSYGLRDIFTVIFKHKTRILVVFLAVIAAVAVWTFQLPAEYEAKSSLLVRMGREYLSRPEVGDNRQVLSLTQAEVTQAEIQIMTNENLLMQVISKIGIEKMYPGLARNNSSRVDPIPAAAAEFKTNLKVEAVKNSSVIEVTFKHKDPKIAAQAVNLLVEYFKEKHLQVFSDPASTFTENQLAAYELKLRESANNLQAFKQKTRVFSIDEQRSLLLRQRGDIDAALRTSETTIHELQGRIPSLKARLDAISRSKSGYPQPDKDRIVDDTKNKILAMQLEEQQLLKKYTETNPLVVNFRKEIQLVRNFLRDQERDVNGKAKTGNAIYQGIQMDLIRAEIDLNSQKARAVSLRQQLSQLNQEVQELDHTEKDLLALKREYTTNEKNYQTYVTRAEEARISENMDRLKLANISVIQSATAPVEAVGPLRGKFILQGVIFGLIAGLGVAFLSEYMRQGLSTPEAVKRRLGLPVLATISRSEG